MGLVGLVAGRRRKS
ncbi:MAG: hypothetical protein Q8N33_00765 [Rhodocyclaceae bacterium]|nr:hypothetical protein [Rhodocyclaceae bacterium]